MKLKNSYVLLMVMAIFLLISIGSVCASDDVAADDDAALTSTETNIILVNESGGNGDSIQEKTNTTIDAQNNTKYHEDYNDKNISVFVKDNASNVLEITKSNLTVTENNKSISFDYNNSIITIKDKLSVGEHNLLISYLGNANYTNSSILISLKIYTNNTLDVPTVVDTNATSVEIPINLTNGIDDNTGLMNSSNTNITYGENNVPLTDWEISGNVLTVNNITTVPTTLTINYTENGISIIKKITVKNRTQFVINPTVINITEGQNATFTVTVYGADGQKIYIVNKNLTITKTGFENKFNNETGELTLLNMTKGIYNLTVTFKGNDVNNTSHATVLINVHGAAEINTNGTAIDVNSTKKGEIQIINITNGVDTFDFNKDDLNITVFYKDGNETKNITVSEWDLVNSTISFTLENANFTTATMIIDYKNGNATKNITINRIFNVRIEIINTVNEYQNGNFTFRLVDEDDEETPLKGKTLSLLLKGNISVGHSATTNDEGIASFKTSNLYIFDQSGGGFSMKQLEVGNYSVELSTSGNLKSEKVTTNLTIVPANIIITIDPYKEYYGSDKKVKITVTNANNGEAVPGIILHLYMPQTSGKDYYFQTNSNGTSEIGVSGLVGGEYDVTVSNNDTKNINNTSAKTKITIVQKPVVISLTSSLTIYFNSGTTATIKVTDKSTGKPVAGAIVLVQIDGDSKKTYLFQTNNKGTFSFAASLTVGKHKLVISTADTRYKGSTVTKTITVKKASATIKAPKVTDYYKGVKYLTVKLTNSKTKKAIYDAKLNIKIYVTNNKYYNYNGNTGSNGQIKLLLNTLKPGTYKVEVAGANSKAFTAKKVTSKIVIKKAPTKLIPKKLTAKKGAKKYFKVTVKNKKTKKVIAGVKVKIKVYTGKKAKTYTAKTNSKGIAQICTNKLKVGTHKVVVTSANKYCTAKQAKSTIKIKK